MFGSLAAIAAAAFLSTGALAQWAPPPNGVIATGWKHQGVAMTRAWSLWGLQVFVWQPAPAVAVGSSIDRVEFQPQNGPPGQPSSWWTRIQSLSWQSEPVLGTPRNVLDAHCVVGMNAQGFAPLGSFMSTSYFAYNTPPRTATSPYRRKVLWISLNGVGTNSLRVGGGGQNLVEQDVIRVNFGSRWIRVRALNVGGAPTQFEVTGRCNVGPVRADGSDVHFGTTSILNHFIMLQFPDEETWGGGAVQIITEGTCGLATPGPAAIGQKSLGVHAWLMWDNNPRVSGPPVMQVIP
jgi:opacity protein-like surface antigen